MEQTMSNGVSPEQIVRAKEISIEDYILSHEPNNVKHVGRALYLKDHDSLEISNGLWNWHSQGIGGKNAVDYLIKVRGYGFVDAVRHLAGDEINTTRTVAPKARPPTAPHPAAEREPLKLPRRFENNTRVVEYLLGRGIDEKLIQECIRKNILYESADFHNAVFVGRDENGKARFAAMRGTTGDFKRDAEGSDKRFGFCIPPESPYGNTVFVFESPIDLLSYDTLCKLGHIEPQDGWRLSLGGTSLLALTYLIERQKFKQPIAHCVVCTDRDTAGHLAFSEISEKLTIRVSRSVPVGKDWNETLQKIRSEVNPLEDLRKDILFLEAPFKYPEAFRIKDGESVKVTYAYDGEVATQKCRFIDEAHLTIGGNNYHISELAEKLKKNGNRVEPIPGQKPTLDVIAAKYGEPLQDVTIPMTEAAIKKLVGVKYEKEILYAASRTEQIKDRKIEIKGSAIAALLRGKDGIAVCGIGGDDNTALTSLHPYWAQSYKRELSPVEQPPPEKADFMGKIDKFKAKAAAQSVTPAIPDKSRDNTSL